MATILSLEPLLHTLPSVTAGKAEHDHEPAGGSTSVPDQHSLAARLQRLWQERGDFSKLSVEQLLLEGESDEEEATATKDGGLDADQPLEASENNEDDKRQEAEEEQSLTQEQLWELKVGMLQGLEWVTCFAVIFLVKSN